VDDRRRDLGTVSVTSVALMGMSLRTVLHALVLVALTACAAAGPRNEAAAGPAPVLPLTQRLAARGFPSVFQAWNPAQHLDEPPLVTLARHDLCFTSPEMAGLQWDQATPGTASAFTPESSAHARVWREKLRRLNPNQILLAEIRYRDAPDGWLPADHPWWTWTAGKRAAGWAEGGFYLLDFANPALRDHVAAQCRAALADGIFDGVMLDWWQDDDARLALLTDIRAAIGPDALIIVNANDRRIPRSAPLVNGLYMECWNSRDPANWTAITDTLTWAESTLRTPHITCLETWYVQSRRDFSRMRATTALSLTRSDGFCLFGDPNELPTPDHLHDWYLFWDRSLGQAAAPGFARPDGAWQRAFSQGDCLYNPPGNPPVTITFSENRRSVASGNIGQTFTVPAFDGDLFVRVPDKQ
jgi:hypothetical protein